MGIGLLVAVGRVNRVRRLLPERSIARLAPGASALRPAVRAVLYGSGLVLFAIALAQPQCGSRAELTKRRGVDVVVALDASKSMLARDVPPNRLERAKLELSSLLDELKGDRVAIVVFAGDAFIQCPLTSDYAAAKMFLRAVDPEQMQQGGTNIGGALLLSKQVLENADRGSKDRVVVLLSDGEDLSGEVGDATSVLHDAHIRVFTVGIGSENGEPIPILNKNGEVTGYKKNASGETVLTRLDRAALASLAQATDGEFFYEPNSVAVKDVAKQIDKLQKSELESRLTVRYDERFQYFAAPGLALLLAAMLVRPSARRE
jgi:Ca-activated chloride channel family protein